MLRPFCQTPPWYLSELQLRLAAHSHHPTVCKSSPQILIYFSPHILPEPLGVFFDLSKECGRAWDWLQSILTFRVGRTLIPPKGIILQENQSTATPIFVPIKQFVPLYTLCFKKSRLKTGIDYAFVLKAFFCSKESYGTNSSEVLTYSILFVLLLRMLLSYSNWRMMAKTIRDGRSTTMCLQQVHVVCHSCLMAHNARIDCKTALVTRPRNLQKES